MVILLGAGGYYGWTWYKKQQDSPLSASLLHLPHQLQLASPVFDSGSVIPNKYTCNGQDINPPLDINGASLTAADMVLVMHDPDASGGDYTHWTVWNISPATMHIAENQLPTGSVAGTTSTGHPGWNGPCPPSGTHHYIFDLYTLDKKLVLAPTVTRTDLEKSMTGHVLDNAELVGTVSK